MATPTLDVVLECELPTELLIGSGTALFVCGWCLCAEDRIASLELRVGGERQPLIAHGMPRLDPFRALHPDLDPFATGALSADPGSDADPSLLSYRSGFWGIARIAPQPAESELELGLHATLQSGRDVGATLARLPVGRQAEPLDVTWPPAAAGPPVAICMATYNPPADLLERQLASIRTQTHRNWVCVLSDDCSDPERYAAIQAMIEGDPRFILTRSRQRLGFYANFERALALSPRDAQFVALADQDDAWAPDKLETLLTRIGGAQLVFSDARVVARDGSLISETWWDRRRNNHSDLLSLLVANSVTGAASLLRRDVLDTALPFPPAQFHHFHDHWIGLVALALGDIAYVDRALYDYVQHGDAWLGHAAANQMTSLSQRVRARRVLAERVGMWRLHYFVDVCRLLQFATVLKLRCSARMSAGKRRSLERFLSADRSLATLVRLAARGARELVGTPETLGAEWMLVHALAWRRLLAVSARPRPHRGLRLDALPPPSLIQAPGHAGLDETARVVADKYAPLRFASHDAAPVRINLLLPTIDLAHFFGGYIAKLNLARRLAQAGRRVRIVTVDPVGSLPPRWRSTLEGYGGLKGLFDEVEVVFGREAAAIEVNRADRFIATTWWTAHIAHAALGETDGDRFAYLIQEYEPFTFPMGTHAALAAESYRFAHFALFSSELLREYFCAHEIGVYAAGRDAGDRLSTSFQNAITRVSSPSADQLAGRAPRKLLFYARPEAHAARNMFELGLLALARAARDGAFAGGWELHGIGTVDRARRVSLGDGAALELIPRSAQSSYGELLAEHDVGLALMYTAHPSLVPIEMASAGMLTVTNSFENKTPEAMTAISTNLITAQPTVAALARALAQATSGAGDLERRCAGSAVNWSTDWSRSFDDALIGEVLAALQGAGVAGP